MNKPPNQIPLVAIVGRPNVGKSRLFNRLTRSRRAIVDDTPGVTRDRHYGEAEWYGRIFNLVDTGGFDPGASDELLSKMREQAQLAIDEADFVIVLFDGRTGLTPADHEITDMMRRTRKRTVYAVNKIDGPRLQPLVAEFYELGVNPLFAISAEHGPGVDEMMDYLADFLPRQSEIEAGEDAQDRAQTHVAVIGRPNVGKSTLINRLIGEERLLTSEVPGTTRDAIDTVLEKDDYRYILIDTAGVRRRRSIKKLLERYSIVRAFKSIDRADVVLYLLDSLEGPTDQDARLLNLVADKGRALVILFNKWDLVDKDHRTADRYVKALRDILPTLSWAPVTFISAKTGQRVHQILEMARQAKEAWEYRVATGELNRFLAETVARNQPAMRGSRRPKLFYMTQIKARPPWFVVKCSYPEAISSNYKRYLLNRLRETFGFKGSPIKVSYRKRARKEHAQQ